MLFIRSLSVFLLLASFVAADHHATAKPGSNAKGSGQKGSNTKADGWIELFNGKDFSGWKVVQNPKTWRIEEGRMIAHGDQAMLYYVGDVMKANFRDFVWECEVLLKPNANSGMYFHTRVEESGWPVYGYEAQLNNTHKDVKKTGGLYGIVDVAQSPAKDNVWFTQRVTVQGKRIQVHVDGKLVTDYTEPENLERHESRKHRRLSSGTFALQGHDPGSEIHFRRVRVKPLPSAPSGSGNAAGSEKTTGSGSAKRG